MPRPPLPAHPAAIAVLCTLAPLASLAAAQPTLRVPDPSLSSHYHNAGWDDAANSNDISAYLAALTGGC